uniref:Rho guanine nucleotide exchange factor 17 n=1 Tax=Hippocampus comes TaxID=109280 RepID=A0A3Q2Y637_HIPCM
MDLRSKIYEQQYMLDEEEHLSSGYCNDRICGRKNIQNSSIWSCSQDCRDQKSSSSPFRCNSPNSVAEASPQTPTLIELTPDPHSDLQTSATTSRHSLVSQDTFCASFLQEPIVRERRVSQGVGLARDSLHSSHSSSTAPDSPPLFPLCAPALDKAITSFSTVPPSSAPAKFDSLRSSRWRFSSGNEEEERSRRKREGAGWSGPSHPFVGISGGERGDTERGESYLSRSKNGRWSAKGIGRSSGSEEESPGSLGPSSREAGRRRSLRKKKRFCGGASATGRDDRNDRDGESDDSDSEPSVTMEHLDKPRHATTGGELVQRLSRSHSAREPTFHMNRTRVQQQWEHISSPVASSTLPAVSRVSKVNIPPFGSRYSSRYSSTEALKVEDQQSCSNRGASKFLNTGGDNTARNASSSMLSKTYYGNFTMYRSPSFGHGDNFPRTQVRTRPKIVPTVTSPAGVLAREGRLTEAMRLQQTTGEDRTGLKNGISKSNPDIATETMTQLNILKSDSSEPKVRKTSEEEQFGLGPQSHSGTLLPAGRRLSLKDLTATLRRAKSFTYSGKSQSTLRCYLAEKSGSSEVMPTPLQERYVQEARQVIQDICQMSTREDDDIEMKSLNDFEDQQRINKTDEEKRKGMSTEGEAETEQGAEFKTTSKSILQAPSATLGGLEAPATPSAVRRRRKFSPPGNMIAASEVCNSTTDSTTAAEANGESTVYRSLSDPMPQRHSSVVEEEIFSSVDSNLLGSLALKGAGLPDTPAIPTLEYKGSVASDLSVYSDGGLWEEVVGDYSGVIRSIVAEPGAMNRLITDDHGNGKAPKKKSFSDPSRRSDASLLSHHDSPFKGQSVSTGPINELDQTGVIPTSSSEPILNKHKEKTWEVENQGGQKKAEETRRFNFDLKLAEALSPRIARRSPRKRPNRLAQFFSHEDPLEPPELDQQDGHRDTSELTPPLPSSKPKTRPKHVRHASEPATFIPISPPPQPQPLKEGNSLSNQPPGGSTALSKSSVDKAPFLEDVTQKYILDINTPERDTDGPGPLPGNRDGAEGSVSSSEGPSGIFTSQMTGAVPQKGLDHAPSAIAPQRTKPRVDMRKHVMMTLLDTERSYVESLRTLIQGYMRPLKQPDGGSIVDPLLVDEMFYQIPEILEHHEHFLEQVDGCVNQWHDRKTVGHLLIQSFSKETLANMYSAYIDNFLNAKDAVRIAKEAKPAFHKFLEQNMRENKEKQALGDLMIKPVQRIPRYELLVKDLLKHTPDDHPDHSFLLDAQRDIKRLAEKINKGRRSAEEAEREARVIQEIEAHIEGVEHILNPQRKFIRQEMVMEAKTVGGKKDRSLFLFSDLIICTTLKRKSGSLRRSSMSLYSATSVIDTSSKYKFLWKLPLEDVEVVKSSTQTTNKENVQKTISRLDEDLSTLGQISKLSETLSLPHQPLDEVMKDLVASVHRELSEKQSLAFNMTFLPTKLEFTTVSAENSFVFEFTSPDVRSNFEQAFEEAKKKLAMTQDQWDPEFLKAIPIMKTRSGMQFSCASPSHTCPDSGCEVWVCNSDGYVGQVCLLNIKDEPTVEACIAVCSARIICIAAVPGLKGRSVNTHTHTRTHTCTHTHTILSLFISQGALTGLFRSGPSAELVPFDSDDTDDEDSPSPSSTLQSQASHSTISSSYGSNEEEQEFSVTSSYSAPGMLAVGGGGRANTESPMDGRAMRRSSRGSFTRASLEDLLSIDPEAYQSSVWLGTEDGCIHVYQSSDNIRNRKNSMKMQHAASILCILYLDNKVFVSLANGEVIVYQREAGSFWDSQSSQTLVLGTPSSPVTKMVQVGGKLWCGSQNRILIMNSTTLMQEHYFQVGTDSSRCVTCMVAYGHGVWLALQGSAHVKLYHAQTWESLTEVDVAPAVHKMLAGADAIIRQHKAACLRITALLACKDLLWIGTSAGVVLTLPIPAISSGTGACAVKTPLVPMGSAHGHTGHVRFLTSVELPEGLGINIQQKPMYVLRPENCRHDSTRRRASAHLPPKNNQLVISGGDGYEDFRLNNSSETIGRDDSTNHLLLWRV